MARLKQATGILALILFLLGTANVGIELAGNVDGEFPPECGQLQHGDMIGRLSFSPLYTPFWLDDPCTGLGIPEPRF